MTAQKRAERLQDATVPVTVLDPATLVRRDETQRRDYFAQVPGLGITDQGDGTGLIVIRGIVTGFFSNPTVAVLIDDVPVGSSTALAGGQLLQPDVDPSDLQRIEVLRGPQGTLYGASSLGGLIKYVTADPSTGLISGDVQLDVGATRGGGIGHGVRASLNLPIGGDVAVRVSGVERRAAGYVDNALSGARDVNAVDTAGGRVSLLWTPSDALSIKLGAMLQDSVARAGAQVTTDYRQVPVLGDLRQSLLPGSGAYRARTMLLSSELDLALGWADLKSITGYGRNAYRSWSDRSPIFTAYAANTKLGNDMRTGKVTQELRLSSPAGQSFGWLVGGFYTHEGSPTVQTIDQVEPVSGNLVRNLLTANFPTSYEEFAVFSDATVHPAPRFSIQAGLRYSRNHQTYRETDTGPSGETAPGIPFTATARSSDHATTFLVTPEYRISPDLMTYLRLASGYRPGGPNGSAKLLGLPPEFGADTTMNYELGVKGDAAGGRVVFDLSGYLIDWNSIQLRIVDPATQFSYFTNGGRARSTGAEVTVRYRPERRLTVSLNASYNSAAFSADPPIGIYARKGDRLPYSPHLAGSVTVDRDIGLTGGWVGSIGGTIAYVGERLGAFPATDGSLRIVLPSYATLALRAGVRKAEWSVSLFARNALDARGILDSRSQAPQNLTTSLYNTTVIQPRTIGVSATRSF